MISTRPVLESADPDWNGGDGVDKFRGALRGLLLLSVLFLCGLLTVPGAVGIPRGGFAPARARDDRLVFALSGDPGTLDPQATAATLAFQVTKSLYDTLVEVDDRGELKPSLAESWRISPDGRTWTFRLRSGIRFHHGKLLEAADVKATLERILNPSTRSPRRSSFEVVRRIEVLDPLVVRISLAERHAPFFATLAEGWSAILPADLIARRHDFATKPVGTGPFVLADWQRDSFLRLQRFDGYWIQGQPRLREVEIRFVSEPAIKVAGLVRGEFDAIDAVPFRDLPRLRGNRNVQILRQITSLVNVVAVNHARPPFRDVRVRRALWHAIDRVQVLRTAYGPESVPSAVFMDVTSPYYVELGDPYPYDPERARQLLREAGYGGGLSVDLVLPQPYPAHIEAGQLVQAMLARAGIQARIRVVEWGYWLARVYGGGEFDLTIIGHTGKLDPDGRLGGFGEAERNYVHYENPAVARLLTTGRVQMNPAVRKQVYREVLRRMTEDAVMVFLGTPARYVGLRAEVRGFRQLYAIDTYDFRQTSK